MIQILAMTLIGGIGRLFGPTIGAFILTFGLEWLREFGEYCLLIYGVLVVVIVMFLLKGIAGMRLGVLCRTEKLSPFVGAAPPRPAASPGGSHD